MKKSIPFLLFPICIVLFSLNNPFFWDSIHYSKAANYFFDTNFKSLILPLDLDAGHPPFFGIYLAFIWKIFGKNLIISHLSVLPFVMVIYWQLYRLVNHFFEEKHQQIVLILLALEPTLLTQSTMVSNDLVLVFFYLLGVNAIIKTNRILLFISLIGMAVVSTRGIIACPALFITDILWNKYFEKLKSDLRLIIPYALFVLIIGTWLSYHYIQTGWVFTTPSPNWAEHRQISGVITMLKNIGIIGWRIIDFGRLGIWLIFLITIPILIKNKLYQKTDFQKLMLLALSPLLIFSLAFIPFTNPIGHRYYMVFYLLFTLLAYYAIINCMTEKKVLYASCFGITSLLFGHFWIYPDNIAKGWDSTLAHITYFSERKAMINYIRESKIPFSQVGTDFPNVAGLKYTDLENTKESFVEKDLSEQKLIFQSNIFNGFSDEELNELKTKWFILKEYRRAGVYVRLYAKSE